MAEVRGGGPEEEPEEPWLRRCRRAQRSYPTLKVRKGGSKKIPLIQGKEQRLCFAGAAVKRYPTPKVRETQVRQQVLQEGVCYDQCVPLAKLYQPLPCFILYSKAKFACYSRCFLTSYFCIPVPYNEKDIFFECKFQKVLQVFIEPLNFSFFSVTGRIGLLGLLWIQSIDLDYCDIEWFALETNRDHSVIFETGSKYCILDSFVDMMATPFLLRNSCPQQQI